MKTTYFLLLILVWNAIDAQLMAGSGTREERMQLAAEMEHSIKTELLNKWYPQCIDSLYGGFLSTYTYDFEPTGPQDKMIVTQARHTWSTAKAARRCPEAQYYLKCSQQGLNFCGT